MARQRPPRDRGLLHRTAGLLDPATLPFYVATPDRPGIAPGWWWRPAGAPADAYLGANVYMAEIALLALVDAAA